MKLLKCQLTNECIRLCSSVEDIFLGSSTEECIIIIFLGIEEYKSSKECIMFSVVLHVQLQVLDSFFSPILGFKTDSESILAWTQSVESADDSLAGHDDGSSHAADTPPPQKKKPRKEVRSMASGIKINDPAPNPSHAPTPSESTDGMFNLHRSNRWG
jgi:hypothetical protein